MNKRLKKKLAKKQGSVKIPKGYGKVIASHFKYGTDYHNYKIGDIVKVIETGKYDIICRREEDGLEQMLLPHHIKLG